MIALMFNPVGFAVASAAVLLIPGPTVIYVAARTARHGLAAGLVAVLGVETGAFAHVLATSLGLGTLVTHHEWLLRGIQYLGVSYLAYLGVHEWLRGRRVQADPLRVDGRALDGGDTAAVAPLAPRRGAGMLRHYTSGVLVDLLNPKTTLFFLAFLPQFVDPRDGAVPAQLLTLGLCFLLLACTVDLSYALIVHAVRRRTREGALTPDEPPWLSRLTAGVYFGLSGLAAFA
jgi:threonine/homoserine/homoserine lactone efflux protein